MPKRRRGKKSKITPEVQEILDIQLAAFREKFGRDPEGHEPIFFDPEADEPMGLDHAVLKEQTIEAMMAGGLPPQFIYAYAKTDLIVTAENKHLVSKEDLAEWDTAVEEYFRLEDAAKEKDP